MNFRIVQYQYVAVYLKCRDGTLTQCQCSYYETTGKNNAIFGLGTETSV